MYYLQHRKCRCDFWWGKVDGVMQASGLEEGPKNALTATTG